MLWRPALAVLILATAPPAQAAQRPDTPSMLTWTQAQREAWYRAIETVYPVRVVRRGPKVRLLQVAAREISPKMLVDGRTWTVDDYMAAYRVSGVLVLRDGEIVLERYGLGRKPAERWTSQSVAKSVTSLLAGAAIQDGRLSLDDTVERHVPELKGSAYEGVTVRQLLTMSSGVKWAEDYADPNSDLARLGRLAETEADPLVTLLATLPRVHPPGATFHYNTAETHLAGLVIARAVGKPLSDYLSEKIWKPYGMEQDAVWIVDRKGREAAGCCLSMTLRDYARVGQFALEGGMAGGKPVVPPDWIAESTRVQIGHDRPLPAGYGYFWWIGARAYEASGIHGQSILVYPKEKLVVVVNSAWPKADAPELFAALQRFQGAVYEAATAPTPP